MPRATRCVPEFRIRNLPGKPNLYLCWSENRRSKRISTGTDDPVAAQQFLADFINGWNAPPPKDVITCNEIIDRYLEHKRSHYEKDIRSQQTYAGLVFCLKPIREYFGNLTASSLNRQHSRNFIELQRNKNLSDASIRKQLSIFTAALNFAKVELWIDDFAPLEKPKPPRPRDKWLKPDEVKRFLDECHTYHIKLFTLLALHTLSRKAAILDLKWEQVDFESRLIDFNPPERVDTIKRRVPVRMNDTLCGALLEAKDFSQTEYVIEYNAKPVLDNKKAFARVGVRAKLKWVTPHVLRHTGATLLAKQGVPMWEIAGIMGDRLATVEKHYAKHHPDYLKNAVNALDNLYG